jgi:hypothetical protein
MTRTGPVISDKWMRDYRDTARRLADMDCFDQPQGATEVLSIKFALFARAATLFDRAGSLASRFGCDRM